jgi:hypothetical protein
LRAAEVKVHNSVVNTCSMLFCHAASKAVEQQGVDEMFQSYTVAFADAVLLQLVDA